MKRLMLLVLSTFMGLAIHAQSDVVSMKTAAPIFKQKNPATAKEGLAKLGYAYKGISSDSYGKDHNYVKNMDLTASFLPTKFQQGNSSLIMQAVDGSTLYIYVFNRTVLAQLKAQVKAMGYDMSKPDKSGTVVCVKDNEPTFTFLYLQQPLPYCVQITE